MRARSRHRDRACRSARVGQRSDRHGVGEHGALAGVGRPSWRLRGPWRGFRPSAQRLRSSRAAARREVAREERHFRVRLGAGVVRKRRRRASDDASIFCAIEARDVGGEFRYRERQISRDAHERPHPHDLAVVGAAARRRHPDDLARGVGLRRRRHPVGLAGDCRSDRIAVAGRATQPSTRSGMVAKLVSPSSAANTAPLMRAAPHRPVRIVPLNHWTETRRRSTRLPDWPSTDSGGFVAEIDVLGIRARTNPLRRLA